MAMPDRGAEAGATVDLTALARTSEARGAIWSYGGEELNANLVLLAAGDGIAAHVNDEVDGQRRPLAAGQALVVPKGARRAIGAASGRFAYLTCHRRRAGLWPAGLPRPGADPEPGR
jgi:hypothetical protein